MNILGIDASNIRHGGGITHLSQLIQHSEKETIFFDKVVIWSNQKTLDQIEDKDWLIKKTHPFLSKNLIFRTYWQAFLLKKSLNIEACSILFVLGGSTYTSFKPVVNFHQNLLPFETREILRFGISLKVLKFFSLRIIQSLSFLRSDGIIFLSQFSKNIVQKSLGVFHNSRIIYHGVENRFFETPRKQYPIENYSEQNPFKIIYVSPVDEYKHQWNVVEAISYLRSEGFPVILDLYGLANKKPLRKLNKYINKYDPERKFIRYRDEIHFTQVHNIYKQADTSVFASSCETFGQIVLESMASGLPIACSRLSSMHEIIKDGCIYFNPLEPKEIYSALKELLLSAEIRTNKSEKAYKYSSDFSWKSTSQQTFQYIYKVQKEDS